MPFKHQRGSHPEGLLPREFQRVSPIPVSYGRLTAGPAPRAFPRGPVRAPRQPAYQTRPGRPSFPRGSHNLSLVNTANSAVNSPNNPIGNAPPRSPNLTLVNPQPHKNASSQSTTQPAPLNTLAPPAATPRPPSAPPSPHQKLDTRAAPLATAVAFPMPARSPTLTLRGPSAAPAIAPVRPTGFPRPRLPFSAGPGRPRPFGKRGGYQARQGICVHDGLGRMRWCCCTVVKRGRSCYGWLFLLRN
jgi:hypothetical protein